MCYDSELHNAKTSHSGVQFLTNESSINCVENIEHKNFDGKYYILIKYV